MASTSAATRVQEDPERRRLRARAVLSHDTDFLKQFDEVWATGFVDGTAEDSQTNNETARLLLLGLQLDDTNKEKLENAVRLLNETIKTLKTHSIDWARELLQQQQVLVRSRAVISKPNQTLMLAKFGAMNDVFDAFHDLGDGTQAGLQQLPRIGPLKYTQRRLLFVCYVILVCVEQKAVCVETANAIAVHNSTSIVTLVQQMLVLESEVKYLGQRVAKKRKCRRLSQAEQGDKTRLPVAKEELQKAQRDLDAAKDRLKECDAVSPITDNLQGTLKAALKAVQVSKELYFEAERTFGERRLPFWTTVVECVFAQSASGLAGRLVKQLLTQEDREAGAMDAACVAAIKAFVEQVVAEYQLNDAWDNNDFVDLQVENELNSNN